MAATSPAHALVLLKEGNERFVAGAPQAARAKGPDVELADGQNPFAVVLGCSDSRVPIETVFDQPAGNIFVVRVAGNFVNSDVLGSIEFAIANLKSKLVLVLGHTNCGAVTAAVAYARDGASQPGFIANLVTALEPAAEAVREQPGDWIANAAAENVRQNVEAIVESSKIVRDAAARDNVEIAGGIYHLHTGRVSFI